MIDVHEIAHHRNGVSGMPFYAVTFRDPEVGEMVATVFAPDATDAEGETDWFGGGFHNPRIAVLALDLLPSVEFGVNSWRGDRYTRELYTAIQEYDRAGILATP